MDDDPRKSIISNMPTETHVHLCNALGHVGDLQYECTAPRCLAQIVIMPCPTCAGPSQRAWVPHRKVIYTPATQPGQRALPHQ